MKQFTQVNNSKGLISRFLGLKSRIVSMYSSNWLVIAPMLFVVFGLFGVNESAWGAWPTFSGSITKSGNTYYVLSEGTEYTFGTSGSHTYDLGGPSDDISFYAMRTAATGIGELVVTAYKDKTDKGEVWRGNPEGKDWSLWSGGYQNYGDKISVNDKIDHTANKLVFSLSGGSYSKKFKDVKVTMFSGVLQPSLTSGSWTFTAADYAAENSYKDFTVDWSNVASLPLSKAVNGSSDDRSQFSYEIFSNTKTLAKGNYGTATIRVYYKHDKVGTHSVKVNVGSYSITFTGTTNKITPKIDTTPTVDAITYGQTISNSQLHGGLVKADLINAAGTVVPGTWTIDENGQTVTTSGGQNTTVNLTFTPSDQNTYNVLHTTQTMFVRSVATISWASAYSAEKPTVPVGKWIENAATTNAAGAVITYSSTSSNVEISADGKSFRFTAESEATVVASHGVTATHGSASETKTFKSTYKAIQVIKWADRFDRLTTEMTSKSLIAEVWIENALTGVRTPSAERTALLQYSSANSSVVSIPNNSTTLHIEGKGTTTITAFIEGDEYYEEASVTMPVKVREPSDGCDYPLWEKDHEGDKDHLYEFFQMNKDEIISPEYDIRMEGQYPDKLSFSHKGEYYNVVGISFWKYYTGPIKAQQKIGNNWQDVQGSVVTPAISDWGEAADLQLDERATHIRFVRPQGGEGHHYIKNVTVSRKHFIRTETPEVDFGNTIKVNSSEYRDVVINYANVQDVLKVTNPFSQDITVDDVIDVDSCGAAGSAVLRIYFSPTSLATVDDYITIRDEVKNNTLSIHVKADAQRADQSITWNPTTSISTIDQILLNGTTNGQEHGQMNVIGYEVTNNDGVISVTNNVVTILKPGTVTITATQKGSTNYGTADPVEKNFTISAEPLTLVAPTAQDITYGQALSESTLTGGSAKDSKNNTVDGTFAWQTGSTQPNASDDAQAFAVVFTPSENAEWYTNLTTTANINVAKANPAVTPQASTITYNQPISASSLTTKTGDVAGTWSWAVDDTQVLTAGDHDLKANFTSGNTNYNNLSNVDVKLTVNKATSVATPSVAAHLTYGQQVQEATLNNTGTAGTWAWKEADKESILTAGKHTLNVDFTPTNSNYTTIEDVAVELIVDKATTTATADDIVLTYGETPNSKSLSTASAALEGQWAWNDERYDDVLDASASAYALNVTFTPNNNNYASYATTVNVTVNKATTTASANDIVLTYGETPNSKSLSTASASMEGQWAWNDERYDDVLDASASAYALNVTFTPNSANYLPYQTTVSVTVNQATPDATPSAEAITYGNAVKTSTLSNTGTTAGTWAWKEADKENILTAGNHTLKVNFTPDDDNYTALSDVEVELTVNKATPAVTPQATAIEQGQTVSQSTLSTKTGSVPGTWSWKNEDANTKPNQGNYILLVNFTPNDADNYNSLTNVQVSLTVNAPSTYVFTGEGDWTADENWNASSDPAEPVDVIVSGNVVISTEVTVKSLTVEEGKSVTITSTGKLTLGDESSEDRDHYGDLYVHNGGKVVLGEGTLQVNDFKLDAKLGNSTNAAASGQVDGSDKLNVNGDAFFQMTFDPNGAITYGWYDFTVPFEVEVLNGIYDANGNKLTNGVDYLVMNYSEAKRAVRGKDWNRFTGTMQPGQIYTITFEETKVWNTFLFKRKANSDVLSDGSYAAEFTPTGAEADHGWNGFGNGTLQHMQLKGVADEVKIQLYNHSENRYEAFDANEKAFAVGTAFFMQVKEANQTIEMETSSKALRAPSYAGKTTEEFRLSLTADNDKVAADRLWISASEDATTEYTIGHDLVKMGTPTQSKVAQMWMPAGELRLCDIEMPLVNNNASTALSIYAPKAGTYTLAVERAPENAILFLTKNGRVMWNLSQSGYLLDLSKGTTEEYGLCLVYSAPQVATGVDEVVSGVKGQKVIIDNKIYIITNTGNIYDATGKKVN